MILCHTLHHIDNAQTLTYRVLSTHHSTWLVAVICLQNSSSNHLCVLAIIIEQTILQANQNRKT